MHLENWYNGVSYSLKGALPLHSGSSRGRPPQNPEETQRVEEWDKNTCTVQTAVLGWKNNGVNNVCIVFISLSKIIWRLGFDIDGFKLYLMVWKPFSWLFSLLLFDLSLKLLESESSSRSKSLNRCWRFNHLKTSISNSNSGFLN